MTPFLWTVLILSLGGLVFGLFALLQSRTVDSFAASTQNRLNGAMERVTRMEGKLDNGLFTGLVGRLERAERELFRKGEYPDLGLREWCRVWRGRLRQSVASLEQRVTSLESCRMADLNPTGKIGRADWDEQDARIRELETTVGLLLENLKLAKVNEAVPVQPEPVYNLEPRLVRAPRVRRRG